MRQAARLSFGSTTKVESFLSAASRSAVRWGEGDVVVDIAASLRAGEAEDMPGVSG